MKVLVIGAAGKSGEALVKRTPKTVYVNPQQL
jgi:nucleoside-diphosphate-sugar epimerase